jgi:hypothetical protein
VCIFRKWSGFQEVDAIKIKKIEAKMDGSAAPVLMLTFPRIQRHMTSKENAPVLLSLHANALLSSKGIAQKNGTCLQPP